MRMADLVILRSCLSAAVEPHRAIVRLPVRTQTERPPMNKSITYPRLFLMIVSAVVLGGLIQWRIVARMAPAAPTETPTAVVAQPAELTIDPAALEAEVLRLKGVAPSASVAMADVGFHFNHLWFAAQKQNWPLATYY